MNRFIAMLLIVALGLQSAVFAPASAFASGSQDLTAHCDDMSSDTSSHESSHANNGEACGCCPEMGMTAQSCVSYCAVAVALLPVSLTFASGARTVYGLAHIAPVLSRFDTPPTPPPIA